MLRESHASRSSGFTWTPQRRSGVRIAAGAVAILALSGTALLAQPQPAGDSDKGKARVVERRGPEVDVRANAGGHVIVLYPQSNSGDQGGVEIVMVERQMPAQQEGQPQGQAMPTGKEYVFNSKDARDQTVSYKLDSNGNARKLMLLAKVNGESAEVRHAGGPEGVQMYTIAMPEKPKPAEQQQQPAAEGEGQQQQQQQQQPPAPPAQAAIIVIYSGGTNP